MSYRSSSIFTVLIVFAYSSISLMMVATSIINFWVTHSTEQQIYYRSWEAPEENVALILGTSKYTSEGKTNPFFKNRITAASLLYFKKKIKHIIVSGDNSLSYYNEPADMKKALIELGVPDTVITLDYAGFRTFDSVVRCKEVFGQTKVIIISQRFHLFRALFIANKYDMKAIGYAAEAVDNNIAFLTLVREYFARCLVVIDIYLSNRTPKFLGKKEYIRLNG